MVLSALAMTALYRASVRSVIRRQERHVTVARSSAAGKWVSGLAPGVRHASRVGPKR